MFTTMRSISSALALSFLLLPASARVIWIPGEFDAAATDNPLQPRADSGVHDGLLIPRDTGNCGGDTSLTYCGGGMPSGFCCSSGYTCLALSTDSSVQAAMCCPDGGNCAQINPISCDTSLQNTTITQLHANPPQKLKTCGSNNACCPMGYDCNNGQCVAAVAPAAPKSKPIPTKPSSSSTATSTTSGSTSSSTSSPTSAAAKSSASDSDSSSQSAGSEFDGKSFAAGFIPGLAIGALLLALILFLIYRKRRASSDSYVDEKSNVRDTLTDLGPLEYRRPNLHGRSISEPQANLTAGHRTDFLRSTPPRAGEGAGTVANGYIVDAQSPGSASPPKVRALFSHSPFMPQYPSTPPSLHPPVPAHMKRGTLSFKISPVRALKKQKSMHSLRRHMENDPSAANASRSNSRRIRPRPEHSRSASTETIQVLMPSNEPYTPDRRVELPEHIQTLASATYQAPSQSSGSTWRSHDSNLEEEPVDLQQRGYMQQKYATPPRPPMPRVPTEGMLGSPYTPTNHGGGKGKAVMGGGLGVKRETSRRDTTFSAMMERAGFRKSDLMMGSGKGGGR